MPTTKEKPTAEEKVYTTNIPLLVLLKMSTRIPEALAAPFAAMLAATSSAEVKNGAEHIIPFREFGFDQFSYRTLHAHMITRLYP